MHMHSIQKTPNQKIHDMGLLDLYEEQFKLVSMKYSNIDTPTAKELENYVNTLQHHNETHKKIG
jgi:hypothetical protein